MTKAPSVSNLLLCFSFCALLTRAAMGFSVSHNTKPPTTVLAGFHGHRNHRSDATETNKRTGTKKKTRSKTDLSVHDRRNNEETPEELLARRRANSWILLADDEEPIRRAVGDFFLHKGYEVTTCADGAAALRIATTTSNNNNNTGVVQTTTTAAAATTTTTNAASNRESQQNERILRGDKVPDCIVSDIRMPVMDGLELLRTIRSDKENTVVSNIPVVLLTAKGVTQDRIAGYDAGADAYLSKPFSPEELVAIVDNVIQRAQNLNAENEELHKAVSVGDLKRDVDEIKNLLLHKGGGGIGNGWVAQTNIFLSKDERAVLDLLSRGLMTKEIAVKTHLSTRRIEQLLTGMFRKTGVKNRTELVRWAVSTGNVE